MCGPTIYQRELSDLNEMTLTREERLAGAEESRRIHKGLWDAVRNAFTGRELTEARRAWDDHIAGHKATAERIRAERQK